MKREPNPTPEPLRGFRFCGIHAGFKRKGRRDFGLVVADHLCVSAAAFTLNTCPAAPVIVGREHCADGMLQAVMINSGNANAATGEAGLALARWSCQELAGRLSIDPSSVLPCSTGVIGVQVDRRTMAKAIAQGVDSLSSRGIAAAARAMMTSDAFPKWTSRSPEIDGHEVVITGIAKGAGMIHPNMATMIALVLTDAALGKQAASEILEQGLSRSFNRIHVDGDTSTNDTAVLMASGEAAAEIIEGPRSAGYAEFAAAVGDVLDELSRMIVTDGEGATKVVDVVVEGARDSDSAERAARAIASSTLFKCALAGADPNWGRIVMALGNSGVEFEQRQLAVEIAGVSVARAGAAASGDALRKARKAMAAQAYTVKVSIGSGVGRAVIVTSDLTEAYVHFNSAYTS